LPASIKVKLGNCSLLKWARESAGYTVPEVARSLQKSEDEIVAWEQGSDRPRYKQLERLANKYKRPVAAFFLPKVPREPARPADFRTMPGRTQAQYAPKSLTAFRAARNWLANARDLLDLLEVDIKFSLPAFTPQRAAEEVASKIRALLGVSLDEQMAWPEDPYRVSDSWRSVLFDNGVIAMVFPMPLGDLRAFSMLGNGLAAIGLNSADLGYGRIFSLFHEVGHLCLRQPGVSGSPVSQRSQAGSATRAVESYCDRFAASFLLPEGHSDVQQALSEVGEDQSRELVESIAHRFKVSKYVVLRRARDLGHIDEPSYWAVFEDWRERDSGAARPSGGNHITNRLSSVGKRLTALVFEALDAKQITLYDTSKLLGLDPRHFPKARARALSSIYDVG
jgi:Zn-dependent peptidase ImmA (M78 family)